MRPTWGEIAFRQWQAGRSPEEIAAFLKREGWRLLRTENVRALVVSHDPRDARLGLSERLREGRDTRRR
jgi:hypothetical protein